MTVNFLLCLNLNDDLHISIASFLSDKYKKNCFLTGYIKPEKLSSLSSDQFFDLCELNDLNIEKINKKTKNRNIDIWQRFTLNEFHILRDIFYSSSSRCGLHFQSFFDRENIFKKLTEKLFYIIEMNQIDIVIFDLVPHLPWELLLWNIMKMKNKGTFCFRRAGIGDAVYIEQEINGKFCKPYRNKNFKHPINELDSQNEILKYIKKYDFTRHQSGGKWNNLEIMNKKNNKYFLKKKIITFIRKYPPLYYSFYSFLNGMQLIYKPFKKAGLNTREISYSSIFPIKNRLELLLRNLKHGYDQLKNEEYLKKFTSNFNFKKEDFIYFPLHMQPEATTMPLGLIWSDQLSLIEYLSQNLPSYKILVKEHPNQYRYDFRKEKIRSLSFYESISKIKNVHLVDINTDSLILTKYSAAVAGISGSNQWEAIIRFKPVIQFAEQITSTINYCININEIPTNKLEIKLKEIIKYNKQKKFKSLFEFIIRSKDLFIYSGLNSRYVDLFMDSNYQTAKGNLIQAIEFILESTK